MPTLADPRPEDIALTLAYLAALIGVARATWREPVGPGRRGWLATGVVVAALAINQQTDAHAPALKAGARMLKTFGLSATSAPILVGSVALIATSAILAIAWLIGRFRKGLPPGTTAGAGLLLLGAHVLGRSARLLHVLQAPWADADLTNTLKVVEGIGLLMILTGAVRWTPSVQRSHDPETQRALDASQTRESPGDGADRPHEGPSRPWFRRRALLVPAVLLLALISSATVVDQRTVGGIGSFVDGIQRLKDPFSGLVSRPVSPNGLSSPSNPKPMTILVIGSDHRKSLGQESQEARRGRADTIMLLNLPISRSNAYVVSIPRETAVTLPGHGRQRLNRAYTLGGPSLMVQAVEALTDVHIDHVAVVEYSAFAALTDALGGVELAVDEDPSSPSDLAAPAATHVMDGQEALAYVSQNHGLARGDLDRIPRQHEWLRAVSAKVSDPSLRSQPLKLLRVVRSMAPSVAIDEGMTTLALAELAWSLRTIGPSDVRFLTVPTMAGLMNREGTESTRRADPLWLDGLADATRTDHLSGFVQTVAEAPHGS